MDNKKQTLYPNSNDINDINDIKDIKEIFMIKWDD